MDDCGDNPPRGRPKSGKLWKDPRPTNLSKICKPKNLRTSWKKKTEEKILKKSVKSLEDDLKNHKRSKLEDLKKRQKINKEKKLLNERKAEITTKITNLKKLKKLKKKQLRSVEKR